MKAAFLKQAVLDQTVTLDKRVSQPEPGGAGCLCCKGGDGCKSFLSYIQGILSKMLQGSSKREGGLDVGLVSLTTTTHSGSWDEKRGSF